MTGSIVPVTTFTPQTGPFTTAPTYRTGMDTGYTSNLTLALNTQYFPGASTSPYGPCLTLPGTVGSYYSAVNTAYDTNWSTSGFTLEAWVKYASFANSNIFAGVFTFASQSTMITHAQPVTNSLDWGFGALTNGALGFYYYITSGYPGSVLTGASALTTGSWNHVVVQSDGTNIYMFINGTQRSDLTVQGYTNAGTSSAASISSNVSIAATAGNPISVGQYNSGQGANFALAKARLVFGTAGSLTTRKYGNVYSSGSFTPSPNLGAIPAGGTVAWSLDTQFPLPTYPSIQDVTQIPLQASSYGSLPTPVGGVTSNVLGPYPTTYPQLDSIRFDGTGYIDYGNAATSVMTSNIWANAWTIEGWVYLNALPGGALYPPIIVRESVTGATTWALQINPSGSVFFQTSSQQVSGPTLSTGTWYHVAATYDGARCNVYTSYNSSSVGSVTVTGADMAYTPSHNVYVGAKPAATYYITGNLADVRVSNVARYSGTTYVVPSAPFTTDSSTLLLLKSLAGQVGTTLQVQGRGLNAVSLGATRSVQSYPPAPMSSYLLDTTSNVSVTYGQGKYVASASSEYTGQPAWLAFDGNGATAWGSNFGYASGVYTGSVVTVDNLGNACAGEWIQFQMPVSVILSTYSLVNINNTYQPTLSWLLGSRDGINWTLVFKYAGSPSGASSTYTVSATQGYNYYRLVFGAVVSANATNVYTYVLNGTEESLCVTNDSKVGVGIANPQRSLEVAGDLVVSGTISGGAGMGSFRNRIINGDMRIAQRGTSLVLSSLSYLADRFLCQFPVVSSGTAGFTYTVNALTASDTPYQLGLSNSITYTCTNGISPSLTTSAFPQITQYIEGYNIADLNWGTSFGVPVTVSFWFKSNVPSGSVFSSTHANGTVTHWYVATFTYNNSSTWQYVTYTVPPPPNGAVFNNTNGNGMVLSMFMQSPPSLQTSSPNTWGTVNVRTATNCYPWMQTAGNYVQVTGVQLEKGTVATPFEFRPFAQELALCQRYMFQLSPQDTAPCYQRNATLGLYTIRFPVTMRTGVNPTISGGFNVSLGATDTTQTSLTTPGGAYQPSATGSQYNFPSAQTIGLAGHISINASGYIRYDAEL
jgi:hypothetical protein